MSNIGKTKKRIIIYRGYLHILPESENNILDLKEKDKKADKTKPKNT